jgi:lysophospholipase L1-like esterase
LKYQRFIALGDSFTEGMCDEKRYGQYRGWADRVADVMAANQPGFQYANLSIRGKLLRQVIDEQIEPGLAQVVDKTTLVSFHAGANDVIRPKYNPNLILPLYAEGARRVAASGATVMLFTVLEDSGKEGKLAVAWQARFHDFNENVRAVAKEIGAILCDANDESAFKDPRLLAFDRLHLNAMGHDRVAQAVLETIELPHDPSWRRPLPPAEETLKFVKGAITVAWFATFALPWMWRRARGKSSGDGRTCKYPTAINWPLTHLD